MLIVESNDGDPCAVDECEMKNAFESEVEWEFEESPPEWFLKLSECRKLLINDSKNIFDGSVSRCVLYAFDTMTMKVTLDLQFSNALWHGIIDLGSPELLRCKITLEDMQLARGHIVDALEHSQCKTLGAAVERCLKTLNQVWSILMVYGR